VCLLEILQAVQGQAGTIGLSSSPLLVISIIIGIAIGFQIIKAHIMKAGSLILLIF
jgi:hypothetical protein